LGYWLNNSFSFGIRFAYVLFSVRFRKKYL
jgi:hypothetical protein